jgi:D-arginine dehydrogenase
VTGSFDIAIVGAGIAGASLAAEIGGAARVVLLEGEEHPGYHATGRSAAFWSETYGGPLIQPLTSASGAFLASPPAEFSERSFLGARRAIHLCEAPEGKALADLEARFAGSPVALQRMDAAELRQEIPGLRSGRQAGLHEPSCADIDVGGLHGAYLRAARRVGVQLVGSARLLSASRSPSRWHLETTAGALSADVLVDAAGAWADEVAERAGVSPIGIVPHRRTMVQLQVDPPAPAAMPLVIDAGGSFYFKPEAGGRLWLSPHDETPCLPCDAAAEEIDVALAIDRLQRVVDWRVLRVERSWAGLRSFAPDRLPVYGFARGRRDFFWFAGQGGFGIQTAPAAAKLAAALLLGHAADPLVPDVDPAPYLAERFPN